MPTIGRTNDVNSRQATAPVLPEGWTDLDVRAIDTVRVLAADAVQKVGNGHPGTAMSLAPVAYLLFQKVMRHDPADVHWPGRDRFVLSCGHSCLTLYIQLYLGGFGLELDDLKALRTWDSKTPGHPEYGHTDGVEITTGPLGQGLANAVGMAMAARRERGLLDPDAAPGTSPFDHQIYVLASDGDIEEGVTSEASSLAGTQRLGNLTVIYDRNHISIEDDTNIALSEDTAARYRAYGWHVQEVDWTNDGTEYVENVQELADALQAAREVTDRPSFISLRTIIGWPAPTKQNTGKAHGSALGDDEVAATKKVLGFDPEQTFEVSDEVIAHTRGSAGPRGRAASPSGSRPSTVGGGQPRGQGPLRPDGERRADPRLGGRPADLGGRPQGGRHPRRLRQGARARWPPMLPELWGGSADLAESNNTTMEGEPSFLPTDRQSKAFPGNPYGRTLHFGIREHAMGSILNGIKVHGGTRPYGGTFLQFSDYMRPAVRLAALMRLPVTTSGPTTRSDSARTDRPTSRSSTWPPCAAIPGLDVVRPADANETAAVWAAILKNTDRPAGLALSRQALPIVPRGADGFADTSTWPRARTCSRTVTATPDVILIGTGSEVQYAVAAQQVLAGRGRRRPGRLDALSRVVRRAGRRVPRQRDPASRSRRGSASRPACRWAGARSSAMPVGSSASTTTAPARRQARCSPSSASLVRPWPPRPGRASPPRRPTRHPRTVAASGPKAPADLESDPGVTIS